MARIFIVHGWEGTPESNWIPWLRNELTKKGNQVHVPLMPDTNNPKMEQWIEHLSKEIGIPDQDTYLVGHSMGCQTILRYLEGMKDDEKVGGAVLVAGFLTIKSEMMKIDSNGKVLSPWIEKRINLEKAKVHAGKIVAIQSGNDPYIPIDNAMVFEKELGARVIIIPKAGHFTIANGGYYELHTALNEIVKMIT